MGKRYLILNADDFGMCRAANLATFDLLEKGGILSATVMVPCGWAPEACKWAKEHPQHAIGVHLTFNAEWGNYRWGPVAFENTRSLRDKDGYFFDDVDEFADNCDIDEVENEIRAQVARAKLLGLTPSHLDNHMGSLYGLTGNGELLPATLKVCGELGYAFRMFTKLDENHMPKDFPDGLSPATINMMLNGIMNCAKENKVPLLDYLIFPNWTEELKSSYETYREFMLNELSTIKEGITETFIHPAFECDELKGTTNAWRCRVWEHKLHADPMTRQHLESKGITYASYRDVYRIRQEQAQEEA